MNLTSPRFVTPHNIVFDRGTAVVTLPDTGAVHRLRGPAAAVARRVVGGELNPSLWAKDEQDALAVLCDLGVMEFPDHSVNRRTLIAGSTALGISTLLMPVAAAAAQPGRLVDSARNLRLEIGPATGSLPVSSRARLRPRPA